MQIRWALVIVAVGALAGCRFEGPSGGVFDSDGFGDGKDRSLSVAGTLSINRCHVLESANGNRVQVTDWQDDMPYRRVLLHQVQDQGVFPVSGDATDIGPTRTPGDAGRWQEVTVMSIDTWSGAPVLIVDPPAAFAFSSSPAEGRTAQACTVPEYTDVDVPAGTVLEASPWNGATGGILAFYANGTVTVAGSIDASARGFRGGQRGPTSMDMNETRLDTVNGAGGGKGESLDGGWWLREGLGNTGNGAGGGNGDRSGGGGGGGAGIGGLGGYQWSDMTVDTRGMPGSRVMFPLEERWSFGGGGGAGHARVGGTDPSCTDDNGRGSNGGTGGGLIWIAAATLDGDGVITADGQRGQCAWNNGAGGGGGGGTVQLRVEAAAFTGTLRAEGGAGGWSYHDQNAGRGPGGGGGGGFIVIDGPLSSPQMSIAGGVRGMHVNPGDSTVSDPWGATAGSAGVLDPRP